MDDTGKMRAKRGPWARFVDWVITKFGDLKLFRGTINPLKPCTVIAYDPGSFAVKGADVRAVMAALEPGDLLVRGYHDYLDGNVSPGYFSHVGLYLGPVGAEDRIGCTELDADLAKPKRRKRFPLPEKLFVTGEQMVVHAVAEGVLVEDLLDFCRCDYMAVLRMPRVLSAAAPLPPPPPHVKLEEDEARLRAALDAGRQVPFAEAFPVLRRAALSRVGYPYDTTFDFTDFTRLSCTEFAYFVTKSIAPLLGVAPRTKRVFFIRKTLIAPDDYVASRMLTSPWRSRSVDDAEWKKLRPTEPEPEPAPATVARAGRGTERPGAQASA